MNWSMERGIDWDDSDSRGWSLGTLCVRDMEGSDCRTWNKSTFRQCGVWFILTGCCTVRSPSCDEFDSACYVVTAADDFVMVRMCGSALHSLEEFDRKDACTEIYDSVKL